MWHLRIDANPTSFEVIGATISNNMSKTRLQAIILVGVTFKVEEEIEGVANGEKFHLSLFFDLHVLQVRAHCR